MLGEDRGDGGEIGQAAGRECRSSKLLAETGQEMDLVAFEKKQLLQQWKSSLVQLARRDEALAAAQTQLEAAREVIRDVENEIIGTRREEKSK